VLPLYKMLVLLHKRSEKMSKTLVNMTLLLVSEEIENVLDSQAENFYQEAFSLPDLRQELITYVLSRVANLYRVIEDGQESSIKCNPLCKSAVKRLHIEAVIHQGIDDLLPRKDNLSSQVTFLGSRE